MSALSFWSLYPLLLIPIIAILWIRQLRYRQVPECGSVALLAGIPRSARQIIRPWILNCLFLIGAISLVIGATRPHLAISGAKSERRNLILVIDVSPSMEAPDFLDDGIPTTRLNGVKRVVEEFITTRSEDRIGIVVFSGRAFLLSPLTTDLDFLAQQVVRLRPGIAGDGTALGDGLALALKRLGSEIRGRKGDEARKKSDTVIFLTDGANNAGTIDPLSATELAAQLGIKVHTIGIGGDVKVSPFGGILSVLGNPMEFDEKMLKTIAQKTGGSYAKAGSAEELKQIYEEIEKLEGTTGEQPEEMVLKDYSYWFCWSAFLSLSLYLFLLLGPLRRIA